MICYTYYNIHYTSTATACFFCSLNVHFILMNTSPNCTALYTAAYARCFIYPQKNFFFNDFYTVYNLIKETYWMDVKINKHDSSYSIFHFTTEATEFRITVLFPYIEKDALLHIGNCIVFLNILEFLSSNFCGYLHTNSFHLRVHPSTTSSTREYRNMTLLPYI